MWSMNQGPLCVSQRRSQPHVLILSVFLFYQETQVVAVFAKVIFDVQSALSQKLNQQSQNHNYIISSRFPQKTRCSEVVFSVMNIFPISMPPFRNHLQCKGTTDGVLEKLMQLLVFTMNQCEEPFITQHFIISVVALEIRWQFQITMSVKSFQLGVSKLDSQTQHQCRK